MSDQESPTPEAETTEQIEQPIEISRRSGWSGFFIFLGVAGIVMAFIGIKNYVSDDQAESKLPSVVFIISGVMCAIQSFFFSFLIDVFTDIRWFLKDLAEKDKTSD